MGSDPTNLKNKVRIAQYISMMPAEEENEELRQWRINSWKNRIAPEGYAFPGDPRNWEQVRYDTAKLSELGKKLLGPTSLVIYEIHNSFQLRLLTANKCYFCPLKIIRV